MLNVEAIDDTPVPEVTPNFAGGLASYPPRTQLGANQFYAGLNTMLNKAGVIQTRRGSAKVGGTIADSNRLLGLGYLATSGGVRKLLGIWNQAGTTTALVRVFDGSTWSTPGGWTPKEGLWATMVMGLDLLYIAQGDLSGQQLRWWDGTTFNASGGGATDAPNGSYMVWGTNRLIVAGLSSVPDTIFFSNILATGNGQWPVNNRIRVGAGDGDPITGLAMWTKTLLVVFKRTRVFIVDIDPRVAVSQFTIEEVPTQFGCVDFRSITTVGRDLWYLSIDGVRALSRTLQGEESEVSGAVSLPVTDQVRLIEEINPNLFMHRFASAAHFKGHWLLAHYNNFSGAGAGTTGVYVLAYNVELGVWEGRWTGWAPTCFAKTYFNGQEQLVFGAMDGQVYHWRHEGSAPEVAADFEDAGAAIATQIGTRAMLFGADQNKKQGFAVEVEFGAGNTAAAATVAVVTDEGAAVTLASDVVPTGKKALTLLHQPPGRALAFEVSSASGKLAVRAVRATAFMQTMEVGA